MSFEENVPHHRKATDTAVRISSLRCLIFSIGPTIAASAGFAGGKRCKVMWGTGEDLHRIRLIPCGPGDGYAVQKHVKNGKAIRIAFMRPRSFPPMPVFSPKVKALDGGGLELDCAAVIREHEKKEQRSRGLVVSFAKGA